MKKKRKKEEKNGGFSSITSDLRDHYLKNTGWFGILIVPVHVFGVFVPRMNGQKARLYIKGRAARAGKSRGEQLLRILEALQSYALARPLPAISISSAVLMRAPEAFYATPLRPFHWRKKRKEGNYFGVYTAVRTRSHVRRVLVWENRSTHYNEQQQRHRVNPVELIRPAKFANL